MQPDNIINFLPGFAMGITRSIISHPFEILKIKSQLQINNKNGLFKGLHYSMIASGIERGCQFYLYDVFKNNNDSNLLSSLKASSLSTCISIPYNFYMVNNSVINKQFKFNLQNLSKTIPIEYSRSFIGSSLFLYTYNELKENNVPLWLSAFGGTTSVWMITYPLDNIRNQIIRDNNILKFDIKNIYRGVQYPILRSIPSSIVGMYVYEKVKNYIL
jgi:hypothetical protein